MSASKKNNRYLVDPSKRRLMTSSAALVAGGLAASSSTYAASAGSSISDPSPAPLPAFDAALCTDQLTATVGPEQQRFPAWNETLRARAAGRESAFVDLDAVDNNLRLVGQSLGSKIGLRLCAKSLPSIQLLEYMMVAACTNRIMAFSEGMVRDLLLRFGNDVDILLGRPATAHALARTFATLDEQGSGGAQPDRFGQVACGYACEHGAVRCLCGGEERDSQRLCRN